MANCVGVPPAPEDMIDIFVDAAMSGERLATVRTTPNATVLQLSQAVHEAVAEKPGIKYAILLHGHVLADCERIADCGLHDKVVVQAVGKCALTADFMSSKHGVGNPNDYSAYLERFYGFYGWGKATFRVHVAPGDYAGLEQDRMKTRGSVQLEESEPQMILDLLKRNPAIAGIKSSEAEQLQALVCAASTATGFGYDSHGQWGKRVYAQCGRRDVGRRFLVDGHLLSLEVTLDIEDFM